jgi:transcriptional regulator with XRE-family HTH domain
VTLSEALSEKIQELLTERGWSQAEFGEQLGLTQSAVSGILRSKRRSQVLAFYEKLAAIFGMPLSVLFADLEQRVRPTPRPTPTRPSPGDAMPIRVTESSKGAADHAERRTFSDFPPFDPLSPADVDWRTPPRNALWEQLRDCCDRLLVTSSLLAEEAARNQKRLDQLLERERARTGPEPDATQRAVVPPDRSASAADAPRSGERRRVARPIPPCP